MKVVLLLCFSSLLLLWSCGVSNLTPSTKSLPSEADLKMEAQAFSLEVIKTYFTEDCEILYSYLSDTILTMAGRGYFLKADKKNQICKFLGSAVKDKKKSFADYLNTYKLEMLSASELEAKFDFQLPTYFQNSTQDFFFIGFELKDGIPESENFIFDDYFVFMVRKYQGSWALKAIED